MIRHTSGIALLALLSLAACAGGSDAGGGDSATASGAVADDSTVGTTDAGATSTGTTNDSAGGAAASAGAMLDPNSASREQLLAIPGMEAHAADALVEGRPYADMVAVNRVLSTHVTSADARKRIYERLWKPIDLNAAKGEEILLIPGVGPRMRHEFEEYRPYRSIAQFRREIGKYVDEEELARLEKYVTIR